MGGAACGRAELIPKGGLGTARREDGSWGGPEGHIGNSRA